MRVFTKNRVIGVVGVLIVGSVLLSVHRRRVDKVWQEMLDTGAELERSIAKHDGRRAVLYGEPLEGKAQEQYALAVELLSESFMDDWVLYNTAREKGDEQASNMRDAIVNANLEALAAISLAAHLTDGGFELDWNDPLGPKAPRMLNSRNLVNLSLMAADQFLENEEPERAVDALLDGMQTAVDHMRSPLLIGEMIGCAMLNMTSIGGLIDQGLLDRIPVDALERLARGMDRLLLDMPSPDAAFDSELAWFIRNTSMLVDPVFSLSNWGTDSGWSVGFRYWFSGRLVCAEYVREVVAWRASLANEDERSWSDWNADFDEQQSRMAILDNPLWGVLGLHQRSIEVSRRQCLTRFNMARLAVAYRLTGSTHDMPDHFGDQLLVSIEADELRIKSLGPGAGSGSGEGFSIHIGS